jgi:signal transduction histidine kinase
MHDGTSDAARALEEVDAIRRRVVNVVGHALRTPVTTLCGMAETLAHIADAATRAALADGVVRNARVVERLLDQILIAADVSTALPVGDAVRIDVGIGMGLTVARTLARHDGGDVTLFRGDGAIVTRIRLPA